METTEKTPTPESFAYRAEMKQLLNLIVHSLYTHREIFLRELISNASDALNKVRIHQLTGDAVLDGSTPLEIELSVDQDAGIVTIEDSGIGMTREDLIERVGTIASSGTLAFVEAAAASGKAVDAGLIGQFGVGFYASFMVADRVEIETRHAGPDSEAWKWVSDGGGTFTIEPSGRTKRGTQVRLILREDAKEYAHAYRVESIVRRYSNFVDFPIKLDGKPLNTVKALWQLRKEDVTDEERKEFYTFHSGDDEEPLGHLHLKVEGRVDARALLFVPAKAPRLFFREDELPGPHLYSNRVFIQDDCKPLLPEYLRFVRGVVDTDDLPLNVSREVTQDSPVMSRLRDMLSGKILGLLETWATDDPERLERFTKAFGTLFKTGLSSDFSNRERIVELLRFESTTTDPGAHTSLAAYVERASDEKKRIWYLAAESRAAADRNPNLEGFRKRGIEVLLLIDPVDVFVLPAIGPYKDRTFESIDQATLDLGKAPDDDKEAVVSGKALSKLIDRFKSVLGDTVEDITASERLVESPASLVAGKQGLDRQTERMMRMMGQDVPVAKRILEINPAHPLIRNLDRMRGEAGNQERIEALVRQVYEGALLLDGTLENPADFVNRMTRMMVEATSIPE